MTALGVREGYRLWAPTYKSETAISAIEDALVRAMTPPLSGRKLLDAGCGTGRRSARTKAAVCVSVDLSFDMLRWGRPNIPVLGDLRAMPIADATFDVVWCRLAIGHVREVATVYAELARVCAPGGRVVVTDFHPDADSAGHRRCFRDASGVVHEIEHYVHSRDLQLREAGKSGLVADGVRAGAIGPEVRRFYIRTGREALYSAHSGLNVVLALAFHRAD